MSQYPSHVHIRSCFDHSQLSISKSPADGHCLLHSIRKGINHVTGSQLSNDRIITMIESYSLANLHQYKEFTITSTVNFKTEMREYLRRGNFSSSYGDIVPKIIADCFQVNIYIVNYCTQRPVESIIVKSIYGRNDIFLRKEGEHYDCLLPKYVCKFQSETGTQLAEGARQLDIQPACDTFTDGKLRIYFKNVRGLSQEDLHDDVMGKELKSHDIVLLVETFCNPDDEFTLEGFLPKNYARKTRHVNARRGSGGLYIFIRESILKGIEILHNIDDIVALLRLDAKFFGMKNDVYLFNCYIVPETSEYHDAPFSILNDELSKIPDSAEKLICMDGNAITSIEPDIDIEPEGSDGDLAPLLSENSNIQINPSLIPRYSQDNRPLNENGRELLNTCKSTNMMIINSRFGEDKGIGKFTRICESKQEYGVLDYMISSPGILPLINNFRVGNKTPESDHLSLELSLNVKIRKNKSQDSPKNTQWEASSKYAWNRNDLPNLDHTISDEISIKYLHSVRESISQLEPVDTVIHNFDEYFQQACSRSFKIKTIKKRNKAHKQPKLKWWDKECQKRRAAAVEAGARVYTQQDRDNLVKACKSYNAHKQRKKREAKQQNLNTLISAFDNNQSDIWDVLNEISGNNRSNNNTPDREELLEHFINLAKPSKDKSFNHKRLNQIKLFIDKYQNEKNSDKTAETSNFDKLENEILNSNFTKDEILYAIDNLKRNKSPGSDLIPGDFVKQCKLQLAETLCDLYNYMIANKTFPSKWAEGVRSAVFKSGVRSDPNNYRGITILPIFEKIFEMIVCNRLEFLNEAFCKVDETNGGFLKGRRTSDNIFILNGLIKRQLLMGKRLYICFVDFSKAFDRVNRLILFYKLIQGGWSGRVIDTLQDLYTKTHSRLKVDGHLSEFIYDTIGVNQGGNASGLLFRKYMSDLSDYLHSEFGVIAGDIIIAHLLWADDLVLMSDTLAGIKKQLKGLQNFCSDNFMIINELKTKIMCFGCNDPIDIKFNGHRIEQVEKYKYVGCIINRIKNVKSDVFSLNYDYLCDKARKAFFAAKSKLRNFGTIPCSILCKVFNCLVKPILIYASDVWGVSVKGRERIDKFYLWFLKNMLGVKQSTPTLMVYGETGQMPPSVECISNVLKFVNRLEFINDNSLVKQVYKDQIRLSSLGFHTWYSSASELVDKYQIVPTSNLVKFKIESQKAVKTNFIENWSREILDITKNPKCRFYSKFKFQFNMEPYLDLVDNYVLKKSLARYRTSSHALKVESTRYKKRLLNHANYEVEKLCSHCNVIEDETHFLLECPSYSNLRHELFSLPYFKNNTFIHANNDDKIMYILNLHDKYHLLHLAKFIYKSFLVHSDRQPC